MKREKLDPVDLMLLGRMDEAAKVYLDLYAKMVAEGDRYATPHILSQLHFCVAGAGQESCTVPESVTDEVEGMVFSELRKRDIDVDERVVKDDIEIAKNNLTADREYSERLSRRWV
jgi:hypothetical protein